MALTKSTFRINNSAPVSGVDFGMDPTGAADCAAAMEAALVYCIANKKQLYIPSGTYNFTRTVQVPTNWSGIWIEGEAQGSASVVECRGTELRFPDCDGLRFPMVNDEHEQIQISNLTFTNSSGTDPNFNKTNNPKAIFVDIDGTRPYNYPQCWWFDRLSIRGFRDAWHIKRTGGALDPNGFIGTLKWSRIHTYRTNNALYNDACYLNLTNWSDCRFHVGGTFYIAGGGGFFDHIGCHWENATQGRYYITQFSFETEVTFHSCGSEVCGEDQGSGLGFINSLVQIGPGTHTRTYRFWFSGHTRGPGAFEQPWRLPRQVEVGNYSDNIIDIEAAGCIIHTPDTIRVAPPRPSAAASPAAVNQYHIPLRAYQGDGTRRSPITQPIAGINGTASGVSVTQPGLTSFIQCAGGALFEGTNIPRSPAVTTGNQIFALSFIADEVSGVSKAGAPISITLSGTNTLYFPEAFLGQSGLYCTVILIRTDTTGGENPVTVDTVSAQPTGTGSLGYTIGYGSFESIANVSTPSGAEPRWGSGFMSRQIAHPSGYSLPVLLTVPAGGNVDLPVRASTGNALSCKVTVTTSDGAYGEWAFNGTTGNAATKHQNAITSQVTSTSITFTVGDGELPDLGEVNVANASGGALTARGLISFGG